MTAAAAVRGRGQQAATDASGRPQSNSGPDTPAAATRRCFECLTPLTAAGGDTGLFYCCRAHQRAYVERWQRRGRTAAPFVAASRITREGTRGDRETGKAAARIVSQLVTRWQDEDARAGRLGVVEYVRQRIAHDFDPTLR